MAGVDRWLSRKRRLGNEGRGAERVLALVHVAGWCGRSPACRNRGRTPEAVAQRGRPTGEQDTATCCLAQAWSSLVEEVLLLYRTIGPIRHYQPLAQIGVKLGVKTKPFSRFFQTQPISWPCAVNNLHVFQFHGMEEVVGSIPTRSTVFKYLPTLRFSVWCHLVSSRQCSRNTRSRFSRRLTNRFWFMVWREAGAVRSARRSRGLDGVHPKERTTVARKGNKNRKIDVSR